MAGPTPSYIDYCGAFVFPPPWNIEQVHFNGFFLRGDLAALQRLVDRCLNRGGPVEYRVISSQILLSFVKLDHLSSTADEFKQRGWFSENEVDFWIFLVAGRRHGGVFVADRVVWFVPFLCVDSAAAMATGREVFGFRKQFGRFEIPADWRAPDRFAAWTDVVETFGPNAEMEHRMFIEARRTGLPRNGVVAQIWNTFTDAAGELLKVILGKDGPIILPGLGLAEDALRHLILHEQRLVFLKQFRDADCTLACYQAIVEAPIKFTKLHEASVLADQFSVSLPHFDSLPLCRDFGLTADQPGGQPVEFAFRTYFDFVLEKGTEIYETT
jgi:hypothetical protein